MHADRPPRPDQVYLFGTCLIDLFVPQAGLDAVRLLEREGLTVHFPRAQSCCGQPAFTSGNPDEARKHFESAWKSLGERNPYRKLVEVKLASLGVAAASLTASKEP